MIHTDLKPENVNLCLTEEEVKEIASRGQLTTTKMFHLPEELKKISAGKITTTDHKHDDFRGRVVTQTDGDDKEKADRAAKRAAKKRKQKEKKREAKK